MTQEEKQLQLLLIDLCERLPYKVKVSILGGGPMELQACIYSSIVGWYFDIKDAPTDFGLDEIKPYLRPISSMTESEIDKLFDILHIDKDGNDDDWIKINDVVGIKFFFPTGKWVENVSEAYDYLNSIHIDYRGLIPMGLALEAKEGMYKTE